MNKCKCCNQSNSKTFLISQDFNYKTDTEKFIYNICLSCGNIYLKNIPLNLNKYYENNYIPYKSNQSEIEKKILDKKIKTITKLNKNKILEVGPGNGEISKKLKELNYDVTVFDINDFVFDELKKYNIKTFKVDFDELNSNKINSKYDLIICYHVIEHLKDPKKFFKNIDLLLNKDGYVVLSTPNSKSLSFCLFKKYWYHLDAPRHLNILNIGILNIIKQKLKIIQIIEKDYESYHFSKIGWETSAYYCFKNYKMLIFSYLIKLFKIPLTLIEFILGRPSQITLILKK